MKKIKTALLALSCVFLVGGVLTACNLEEPTPIVTISNGETATLEVGETLQLNVALEYYNDAITYTSSSSEVATVSDAGLITVIAKGEATITASAGDISDSIKITVTETVVPPNPDIEVESISLNKSEITLEKGYTETLTATVLPDNANDKTVTWETSDDGVATVSNAVDSKYKESTNLEGIIKTLSDKIESDGMLIDRLESLSKQYKSDLERLNFIIAGKDELDKNETEHECPYCHSKIHEEKEQINLSEIEYEANYAIHNLNDVSETLSNLLIEHDKDEIELETNKKKLLETNQVISKLVEERFQLERSLRQFDELIECQKRIEYLQDDNEKLEKDLFEVSGQLRVDREDFVPTEYFQSSFYRLMTENMKGIMQYCGDHRYVSVEFDEDTFDISIRGQSKSANNEKGFRAFVNSVTLLSFRKFLDEKGKHQLPVYVIDSPLKNLDAGDLDKDNIKDNFFKYLIHASNYRQMIIIENTNNFTMTEELRQNANVIEFTHGTKEGRYGFLLDHHD